jgi:hypothetical protein
MQYRSSFRSLSPAFCLCRVPIISPRRASASLRLGVFSSTTGYRNPDGRNLSLAHLITAATASRPYPRPCADSLIQSPVSNKVASAGCKPAVPINSFVLVRRITRCNPFPVFVSEIPLCHMVLNSVGEAGGFHDMNLATRALAPSNDSAASAAVNARIVRRADVRKFGRGHPTTA